MSRTKRAPKASWAHQSTYDAPLPRAGEVAFFRSFRMSRVYEGLASERFFGPERSQSIFGLAHLARSTSADYWPGDENSAWDLGSSVTPIAEDEVRAGNGIYAPHVVLDPAAFRDVEEFDREIKEIGA